MNAAEAERVFAGGSGASSAKHAMDDPKTRETARNADSGLRLGFADWNESTASVDIFLAMSSGTLNHRQWWRDDFCVRSEALVSLFFDRRIKLYHSARFLRLIAAGKTDFYRIESIGVFDAEISLRLEPHRSGDKH